MEALRRRRASGRPAKLADAQVEQVRDALVAGATAYGFDTDLWTLDRVAQVVEQVTTVHLAPASVGRLLGHWLGWSVQQPERQVRERDEEAIRRWVQHEWPRIIKGQPSRVAGLLFWDESGVCLLPVVRRTWAPRGGTPILRHRCNWKRASMAAAVGYHACAPERGARLCFHLQPASYNTASLLQALAQLRRFYDGEQVVLLGDGLGAHGS